MDMIKLPAEKCGVKTNEHPTMSKIDHAQKQQQPEQAATESNLSHASTNLESILFNYLPVQEHIFKHLPVKDLLKIRDLSYSCKAAINCYLGGVKTIYENRGQFDGVDIGDLSVILPHTRSLQIFTSRKLIDYDITTLFTNNPKLRVLRTIATSQFHNFLTSSTSKLESLSAINLVNRDDEKINDQNIPKFCAKLSELCPNLSDIWLSMNTEVFNDDSLAAIGGLNSLENLRMEKVTIRGRLSILLSRTPNLRRLKISQCGGRSDADLLTDISQHCNTLYDFQFKSAKVEFSDGNGDPGYCDIATNIVIANQNLQSFRILCGIADTCDGQTLDAMTDRLENVKQLAFTNLGGFPDIGDNFRRFAAKFQNLSHLAIKSLQISQEWLNVIGSNCSNLEFLSLDEGYSGQLSFGVDITQICNRNKKLMQIAIGLTRGITLGSCQSLTTLDLKYILLNLPSSNPVDEFHRIKYKQWEKIIIKFVGVEKEVFEMELIISTTLHLRLQTTPTGFLVGVVIDEDKLLITGCLKAHLGDITSSTIERLESFLPSGFGIVGTFGKDIAPPCSDHPHLIAHIQTDQQLSSGWIKSNQVKVVICEDTSAENMITNHFVSFRLKSSMTIHQIDCSVSDKPSATKVVRIRKGISKKRSIFHLPDHRLLLKPNKPTSAKLKSVGELLPGGDHVTDVEVVVYDDGGDDSGNIAPHINCHPAQHLSTSLPITNVEALCFVPRSLQSTDLAERLQCSLRRVKSNILTCPELISSSVVVAVPQLYEFLLPGWLHQVRVCYPANQTDAQLCHHRREVLHEIFMQSLIPTFHRNLAFTRQPPHDDPAEDTKIVCPHLGLDESTFSHGYQVAHVQGKYKYYHYMHDGIDDTNWGCAYRSLQTIISWAKFHGYCSKPVPTHKQIQEILVRIGDKPKRLIGSSSWIGSVEVQRALEEYTGMSSRIISLTSGSEIVERGRELLIHFRTEGTPIMIGGGVKAHTIVGVAFDEITGATQFLVLDPHYEGSDDNLQVIHKKGWCNWKDANRMWKKKTFYNLCLPLRCNQV